MSTSSTSGGQRGASGEAGLKQALQDLVAAVRESGALSSGSGGMNPGGSTGGAQVAGQAQGGQGAQRLQQALDKAEQALRGA